MKILTQDRLNIMEMASYIYTCPRDNKGEPGKVGIHMVTHSVYLGIYDSEDRAKEVMQEMFQCFSDGKKAYVMPEK